MFLPGCQFTFIHWIKYQLLITAEYQNNDHLHCFSAFYHPQTQIVITETKPIPSKWNTELGRKLRAIIKTLKIIINGDAGAFALAVQ